jgi:hypothetical protein
MEYAGICGPCGPTQPESRVYPSLSLYIYPQENRQDLQDFAGFNRVPNTLKILQNPENPV